MLSREARRRTARRPRASDVCGGRDDWRRVIAGEEMVPEAEDEHRDYRRRFLRPIEVRSRVRSVRYGKTLNDRLTSQISLCFRCIRNAFRVARFLPITDFSTNLGLASPRPINSRGDSFNKSKTRGNKFLFFDEYIERSSEIDFTLVDIWYVKYPAISACRMLNPSAS
jgi:hypothetical protein